MPYKIAESGLLRLSLTYYLSNELYIGHVDF